jgi:hypothetical protein
MLIGFLNPNIFILVEKWDLKIMYVNMQTTCREVGYFDVTAGHRPTLLFLLRQQKHTGTIFILPNAEY